jgi:cell division protein ZapA
MQKPVEVTILGQKFVVRSDSDDTYVRDVAAFVDQRMNDILQKTKSASNLNVAILSAMNIADEFFSFKRKKKQSVQAVEKKIEEMIAFIDLQK